VHHHGQGSVAEEASAEASCPGRQDAGLSHRAVEEVTSCISAGWHDEPAGAVRYAIAVDPSGSVTDVAFLSAASESLRSCTTRAFVSRALEPALGCHGEPVSFSFRGVLAWQDQTVTLDLPGGQVRGGVVPPLPDSSPTP
jgi:hypothetical protein